MRPRVDDYTGLRIGQRVREKDGRHVAVVDAVVNSFARVTFEETGWKAEFYFTELEPEDRLSDFLRCGT